MSDARDPRSGRASGAMPSRGSTGSSSGAIPRNLARVAGLCFLGPPVDHGDGPACYRRQPEIAKADEATHLVIQRHGEGEDAPTGEVLV